MTAAIQPRDYQDRAIAAALTGLSPDTRRAYSARLAAFFRWLPDGTPINRESVQAWLASLTTQGVKAASINQALAAIKRLIAEAAEAGWIPWDVAIPIQAIESRRVLGVRTGHWLTLEQAGRLLALPDRQTLTGRRDAAVLSLLLGCGLRRAEACGLTIGQVQSTVDGRRVLANVTGKGGRVRTIAVPAWVWQDLTAWIADLHRAGAGDDSPLLRSFRSAELTHDRVVINGSLGTGAIWRIVRDYAAQIGLEGIAPHDLRRSLARLSKDGGAPLDAIQRTLGHASLKTTQNYIASTEAGDAGLYVRIEKE